MEAETAVTVLIATDGSDAALHAGTRANELFGPHAKYAVVSVAEGGTAPITPLGITAALYTISANLDAAAPSPIEVAEHNAQELTDEIDSDESVTVIADLGGAGPTIVDLAAELGTDVLVVGAHEQSWWDRFLDGSTTDYLVKNAPCDVLVVRSAT